MHLWQVSMFLEPQTKLRTKNFYYVEKVILIIPHTAEPGFIGVQPGNGVNTCPPVSVCQKVSTMEHFSCPIIL